MAPRMVSERSFFGASALLFIASAAAMVALCTSMPAMGGMSVCGGRMMAMAWTRLPGQTWSGAAAAFLGMWTVMMVAMMLPALVPMLWRYRRAVCMAGGARLDRLALLVGAGYFLVWILIGLAVFPPGAALAVAVMQWQAVERAVPVAGGLAVLIAGAFQFTAWKARRLACCRNLPEQGGLPTSAAALLHGTRLGLHCSRCCANLMVVLLVIGVMDLRAMALVTAAIAVERLAPSGERAAWMIGAVIVGAGMYLLAQAAGLG